MILNVNGLKKEYKEFALEDISFDLPKGYIMGLVGENGAGKTTLIKSILGMVDYQGEIRINDIDIKKGETLVKQQLGVVLDTPFFPTVLNLNEVGYHVGGFYEMWDKDRYYELLERFGLPENKLVKELSKGMGLKLQLAVALSHNAKLLIWDEPTSGLDPIARDELLDILMEYIGDGERSVLFSTHICRDLEKVADYIMVLTRGRQFFSGEMEELLNKYKVVKGDWHNLDDETKKYITGIRIIKDSFEGMVCSENLSVFSDDVFVKESVSIDDIIFFAGRSMGNGNNIKNI